MLGIETSCDDTAVSIVDGQGAVRSSVVSSQLQAHQPYGGVVPEIASREHLKNWPPVIEAAFSEAEIEWKDLGGVAVTSGPGLVGSLLVGMSIARAIATGRGIPFFAVHHLQGHLFSPFLDPDGHPAVTPPNQFIGLVVSGGHTALYRVEAGRIETLGTTRDDAMGEAFDKVGKRLGFDYPQGPRVDQVAEDGDPDRFAFTLPKCGETLDFSYSGLKTQAVNHWSDLERNLGEQEGIDGKVVADLLAGFRQAAVSQILDRLDRLQHTQEIRHLAVSGGAAANRLLRRQLVDWAQVEGIELSLVPLRFSGDNAAMIAHAALRRAYRGDHDDPFSAEASSRVTL